MVTGNSLSLYIKVCCQVCLLYFLCDKCALTTPMFEAILATLATASRSTIKQWVEQASGQDVCNKTDQFWSLKKKKLTGIAGTHQAHIKKLAATKINCCVATRWPRSDTTANSGIARTFCACVTVNNPPQQVAVDCMCHFKGKVEDVGQQRNKQYTKQGLLPFSHYSCSPQPV